VLIMLVPAYYWDGEGMSNRNQMIFQQLRLLMNITGLRALIVPDLNMTPACLQNSEWPFLLEVGSFCVGESTYKGSASSEVDHALLSRRLTNIVSEPELDRSTSWRHVGLRFEISARPREYHAPVFQVRRPLPVSEASLVWAKMNSYEQYQASVKSRKKAKQIL